MGKTLKMFNGVQLTTKDSITKYPDITIFTDGGVNCTDAQKSDIIRGLLIMGTLDLSNSTEDKERCILDLY
jgi:hypothetical protein